MEFTDKDRVALIDNAVHYLRRGWQGSASISITSFDMIKKPTAHWDFFCAMLAKGDMLGSADILEHVIRPEYSL